MRRVIRRLLTLPLTRPAVRPARPSALGLLRLEDRTVPATFTVTNANDAGTGSLRQAILGANADGFADTIVFGAIFAIPKTINVASGMPILNPVTITGPGADKLTLNNVAAASATSRIFDTTAAPTGAAVAISGVRITGGNVTAGGLGGGIAVGAQVVTLTGVVLEGNAAGDGGAVSVTSPSGKLTLNSSTLAGNNAGSRGGAVFIGTSGALELNDSTISGNTAGDGGGGVYFFSGGAFVVERSTFTGNRSNRTGLNAGGAVYFYGTPDTARGGFVISNSTFSGNQTTDPAAAGGALLLTSFNAPGGTIRNSTFTLNSSAGSGGGVAQTGGLGVVTFVSTIVAQNAAPTFPDVYSPATSGTVTASHSLVGDQTGLTVTGTGNLSGDAGLGPLANNGGPTLTHALLPASAAVNAGSNPAPARTTDQRGLARVSGPTADIGAYEFVSPAVAAFTLTTPTPTNAAAAAYRVRFGDAVTGLTAANFILGVTGTAAGTVGTPATTDGGFSWTIPVTGLAGEGTATLTFDTVTGLTPAVPGTFPLAGPVLTLDRVAPTATVVRVGPALTNAATVAFTVTFSEPVATLAAANFALAGTGTAGASIASVTPSTGTATSFTVVVAAGADGTLGLDLVNSTGLADALGLNPVATPVVGELATVDRTPPTVASFLRTEPAFTNAAAVGWTVTFSEPMSGVTAASFDLPSAGLTGAAITSVTDATGAGTTFAVTASTGTGDGVLTLNVVPGVVDVTGNALGSTAFGPGFGIDRTRPAVTVFALGRATPTRSDVLTWNVTFSEPLTGVTAANFALVANGVAGATVTAVSGAGTTYVVTVASGTGSGTLGLNFVAPSALADAGGNRLSPSADGPAYAIDRVLPTATLSTPVTTRTAGGFPVTATFGKPVAGFDLNGVTVANGVATNVLAVNASTYTFTVTATDAGPVTVTVNAAAATDVLGNANPASAALALGFNPPAITATATTTSPGLTNLPVAYRVEFSLPVTGLTATDVTPVNGTVSNFASVGPQVYTFTVTPLGVGSVGGTLPAAAASGAFNVPTPAVTLPRVSFDDVRPGLTVALVPGQANPVKTAPVRFAVTFTKPVTGFDAADLTVTAAGTPIVTVSGSGASYVVTVAGIAPGAVSLAVAAGAAVDAAGNASRAAPPASATYAPPVDQFLAGAGGGNAALIVNANGAAVGLVTPFADAPTEDGGTVAVGVRVASADFNGDGVLDRVVGTGPGGPTLVRVLDGKTGAELFAVQPFEAAFTGGVFVAAGDVTGDGTPDLLVTPDEGGGPRVRVFSGVGFGTVLDFLGIEDPNFRGGARVAVAGLPGDGGAEIIVAAGVGGGPRVTIWSGPRLLAGGTALPPLANFFAFEPGLRNGAFVAAGDVTGDGTSDFVFGGGPGGGPRVRVFDGAALLAAAGTFRSLDDLPAAQLANFFSGDATGVGGARVGLANLDADGRADLIVGAGPGGGSRVRVYPGRTLTKTAAPTLGYEFDAFPGSTAGVYVG